MDLQEQVKAYTAWVNSQLKKKSLQIKDLSKDLNDGVLLIAVVEIVSGQQLKTVQPKNDEDKKENVLKVINFMKHSGIKLHHVTTEEIIAGNVKTLMQLILALAAHFKPASIGGRRSATSSPHTSTPNIHRLKTSSRESSPPAKKQIDFLKGSQDDFQQEIKEIESLALKLQQLLLLETDGEAIDSTEEQLVIMQAKMNQSNVAKQQYEDELVQLQETCKDLTTSNTALECRLKQQENELMLLKQELMRSNLARDKLKSDKAELSVDVEDFREEMEKYRSKFHEKELHYVQLEDDFMKAKADHVRALARKDKQIREMEKQQQLMSPTVDNVFRESSFRLSSPNSPKLGRKSPSMLSRNSPTLARKSPVSRHNPPRRRKISDNSQTRILYFTDRDMTPAMTTIAKRVGDITLGEFKAAVKKQGNFRFIFKALDPELGTVKEEVFRDDDVIPGWEGKIVAWVEEVLHV